MVITIEQALYPLLLTFSVFGFSVYFPKKVYFSISYGLTMWIIYICLYYYLIIEFKVEIFLIEMYNVINMITSIFIIIVSVIMNIYHNKRFQIFIKRLAAVDNTLEKLGTPKIYHKLYTYVKWMLIGWLMSIILLNVSDMTWWWEATKNHQSLILPYIVTYHYHINVFIDLSIVIFLWYIGTRFDKVNEHMRYLLIKEKYGLRCIRRKTLFAIRGNTMCINYYKHVLWISMHLHFELCQIAREFNGIFGIQMTVGMVNCMICLLRHSYYIYTLIQINYPASLFAWISILKWWFFHGIRLFFLNYACENVSSKANEMERIVHQLLEFLRYADVRNEIYQFMLQMLHHPLKFTALGFFYFGSDVLRKLIMSFITCVIILIQLATIPKSVYEYLEEHKGN